MTDLAAVWDDVPRRPPPAARAANDPLDLTPLGETIGAVVHGVDLARAPGPETLAFLREAAAAWKVVFVEAAARPGRRSPGSPPGFPSSGQRWRPAARRNGSTPPTRSPSCRTRFAAGSGGAMWPTTSLKARPSRRR